jgi:hypothetical protein
VLFFYSTEPNMPRRSIPIFLAVLAFAVLTVNASEFWLSKDWKQWSKDECATILAESPWAHTWRSGDMSAEIVCAIQLRSSLPVREAIVRQLQFEQKYDKLSADQRSSFDAQAAQILNRTYDDTILVQVDFGGDAATLVLPDLRAYVQRSGGSLNAALITDDGTPIPPTQVDWNPKVVGFVLRFPRLTSGVPTVKVGQKHFAVQFQIPVAGVATARPSRHVHVEFDLDKMLVDGKLSY